METLDDNITPAMAQKLYRFHVGLALAGILTAIICSLTLLYDSITSGEKISGQVEMPHNVPADLLIDLKQITAVAIDRLK